MTGIENKIIIDEKKVFLFFLSILLVAIPIGFAETNTNNAKHNLTEILHNGISVDLDKNDWVDEVDYAHKIDFIGIVSDLTCSNGVMVGIDENGPVCLTLEEFYKEFNEDKRCHSNTKKCNNKCKLECNAKNEEMTFGTKIGKRCHSEAYIVCCKATLPKKSYENYTSSNECNDSDRYLGKHPGKQIFIKGHVVLGNDFKEDYCIDEYNVMEYYCKNKKIKNKVLNCKNGCEFGACIK